MDEYLRPALVAGPFLNGLQALMRPPIQAEQLAYGGLGQHRVQDKRGITAEIDAAGWKSSPARSISPIC
jgi:hypothetical protein